MSPGELSSAARFVLEQYLPLGAVMMFSTYCRITQKTTSQIIAKSSSPSHLHVLDSVHSLLPSNGSGQPTCF